jgi:hypothetical protein
MMITAGTAPVVMRTTVIITTVIAPVYIIASVMNSSTVVDSASANIASGGIDVACTVIVRPSVRWMKRATNWRRARKSRIVAGKSWGAVVPVASVRIRVRIRSQRACPNQIYSGVIHLGLIGCHGTHSGMRTTITLFELFRLVYFLPTFANFDFGRYRVVLCFLTSALKCMLSFISGINISSLLYADVGVLNSNEQMIMIIDQDSEFQ